MVAATLQLWGNVGELVRVQNGAQGTGNASVTLAPPAPDLYCMDAATMSFQLHEPSQRELVKQSRAGMGNSGLMTVKSRESCK